MCVPERDDSALLKTEKEEKTDCVSEQTEEDLFYLIFTRPRALVNEICPIK